MVAAANTPTKQDRAKQSRDFMAFAENLAIPTARGPQRFGDCWAPFQQKRFAEIAPSIEAMQKGDPPPKRGFWWEATKGAAKDSDLAVVVIWVLLFIDRPVPLVAKVGAADQDQARELRQRIRDILLLNPWLAWKKGRTAGLKIEVNRIKNVRNENACDIIATDAASAHGDLPDLLICNELSHVTKQEFVETMMDNAAKVSNGVTIIATNAGFTGTWQYRWRELYRNDTEGWCFNKVDEPAPWLDPKRVEDARLRNSTSRFARLWRGIWASGGGDALDNDDIRAAISLTGPIFGRVPNCSILAGLDLGIKHDHAAFIVLACDHLTHRVKLLLCQSWKPPMGGEVDLIDVEKTVLEAHQRYNFATVGYDPHQAKLMAQQLTRKGVPMNEVAFVGKALNQMASSLLNAFRSRAIDLYPDEDLMRDLERLTIVEKSYGYKLEAVHDEHGHADRATALALILPLALQVSAVELPELNPDGMGSNIFGPWGYEPASPFAGIG